MEKHIGTVRMKKAEQKPMEDESLMKDDEHINPNQFYFSRGEKRERLQTKKERSGNKKGSLDLHREADQPGDYGHTVASQSSERKKVKERHFNDDNKRDASVLDRAAEVQANLEAEFPCFVKTMVPSNTERGFFVKLPKEFCCAHLPRHDTTVFLVDESGEEYKTTFLAERFALSGGWRKYAKANYIVVSDVLVFQMFKPSKFKVYVVRANSFSAVDGALALLHLNSCPKQIDFQVHEPEILKHHRNRIQMDYPMLSEQPEDDSENIGSNISESTIILEHDDDFGEVKAVENFKIVVNGLTVDSELSRQYKSKYYELCCSQKSYLHGHLLKTINKRLAAEIIIETVNIAYALRGCNHSSSEVDYITFDKTLEAFEVLGMNVSFLRAELKRLMGRTFDLGRSYGILEAQISYN